MLICKIKNYDTWLDPCVFIKRNNLTLVLKNNSDFKFYLSFFVDVKLLKQDNDLVFFFNEKCNLSFFFFKRVRGFILKRKHRKIWVKKIIIKGMGYRVYNQKLNIYFKIGYSHLKSVFLPQDISIRITKKTLILICGKKYLLGNFFNRILKLKKLNIYKEKGLLSPYKKIVLKTVKKKKIV